MILQRIEKLTGLSQSQFAAVYPYGSRVYGTESPQSDYDYIVVASGKGVNDGQQYDSYDKTLSVHVYDSEHWQDLLDQHKIMAMECQFIRNSGYSPILENRKFKFTLNKSVLRSEISAKASNSWVKCKKKLEVENDYYIGIKSLFHSFRIPYFGLQIAQTGEILYYHEANPLWNHDFKRLLISKPSWSWIKETYQQQHNKLLTEFRKYAELK